MARTLKSGSRTFDNKAGVRIKMTEFTSPKLTKSYFVVFVLAAALYAITCAPGSLFQDSGMFQYRIWHNDVEGGLGLALAHPLYHLIGMAAKSIPLGEYGYRINLISAICGAITVANIFLLIRFFVGGLIPAAVGALSLTLSWTFWQHCAIAEVYTLYTAIFSAELIFLFLCFKKQKVGWLYLLAFFNGLSISNHMWGILPLACYLVMIVVLLYRRNIRFGQILLMALPWTAGCAPYLYLIIRELIATGDFAGTIQSALVGGSYGSKVLNVALSTTIVKKNFMFFGLSFPTPNILLFFVGLFAVYKVIGFKTFANMLLAMMLIFFVFAFRYTVPDRYAFFIPFYCLVCVFIGVGCRVVLERFKNRYLPFAIVIGALLPVGVYAVVPIIAERMEFSLGTKRQIPYRNEYTYFLRPWQCGNDGPKLFAADALDSVEDNGVIIADGTTVYALWYAQQFAGLRRDVKIISKHGDYKNPIDFVTVETLDDLLAAEAVYVVTPQKRYCPEFILESGKYDFVKSGPVFRIKAISDTN
ncbi:MAG: DUF2723 domain-containing protein [Planctomycetes bacterium]|nr:DUF2723 domain-containing protein [Planctomycetota bacterium]